MTAIVRGCLLFALLVCSSANVAAQNYYEVVSDVVNMRSRPSSKSQLIGRLRKKDIVEVTGKQNGWAKVSYKNKTAFVLLRYLVPLEETDSNEGSNIVEQLGNIESQQEPLPDFHKVVYPVVTLRSHPNQKSQSLGRLNKNDIVEVIGSQNGWAEVKYNNQTAYVSLRSIEPLEEPVRDEDKQDVRTTVFADNQKEISSEFYEVVYPVILQSRPDSKAQWAGRLNKNDIVEVTGTQNGWAEVKYNNQTAYVSLRSVKPLVEQGQDTGSHNGQSVAYADIQKGGSVDYNPVRLDEYNVAYSPSLTQQPKPAPTNRQLQNHARKSEMSVAEANTPVAPRIDRTRIDLHGDYLSQMQYDNISDENFVLLGQARDLEQKGKHRKAGNIYDKLCKKKNLPNSYIWFAAGRNAVSRGKWKNAVKDFEKALQCVDCSSTTRQMIDPLFAEAVQKREEQIQERKEMWGSLIGETLLAGAQVYMAHENAKLNGAANKNNTIISSGLSGGSVSSSSSSGGSSSSSSSSKECAYCHGTGKVLHESNVSTFGLGYQSEGTCQECGAQLSNQTSHKHVKCGHCGGTGQRR